MFGRYLDLLWWWYLDQDTDHLMARGETQNTQTRQAKNIILLVHELWLFSLHFLTTLGSL